MRTALRALLCVSTTKFKKGTRSGRRRSGAKRSGGRPNEGTQFALSTQRAHSNVQRNGQLFCEQVERERNMESPKGRIVLKILRSILDPLRVSFVGFNRVLGVGFWWFSIYRNFPCSTSMDRNFPPWKFPMLEISQLQVRNFLSIKISKLVFSFACSLP